MVDEQIAARDIIDPKVIGAMRCVPRELFVPPKYRHMAFSDQPLPIGKGQTISQPYVVAYMVQSLQLTPSCKVLEIGTGSGYQTAILARIVASVYTIEVVEYLWHTSRRVLEELKFKNIHFLQADGRLGWPEEAPFDRIIVSAASKKIPPALLQQLAPGGNMVIPIGSQVWSQNLLFVHKTKRHKIHREKILPVRFVPLVTADNNSKKGS